MIHDSVLFNYQNIISGVRENAKEYKEEYLVNALKPVLDSITDATEYEDLPLYQSYFSIFDVENDLKGFELHCPPKLEDCKADFMTLLQLIAASLTCDYDLEYDKKTNSVDLTIAVNSRDGQRISRKLHELKTSQICGLFFGFLEEMLYFEGLRLQSEYGQETFDRESKMRIKVYQKKIQQLKTKNDCDDIMNELEKLLSS